MGNFTTDSRWYFLTPLLPILSLIAMWGIHRLLNKLVPIPTKDEIQKDNSENDDDFEFISEKEVKESRENLINFEKTVNCTSSGFFKPSIFLIFFCLYLPIFVLIATMVHAFNVHTIKVVCYGMDSKTFHNFSTLLEEDTEPQRKLNQWQNDVAAAAGNNETSDMIKEYFAQRIQNATEETKITNATLEPQFQIYKECFITKQNQILIYCFGSWLFLYIFMTIFLSVAIHWIRMLESVDGRPDHKRYIRYDTYLSQIYLKSTNWMRRMPHSKSDKSIYKKGSFHLLLWYGPFIFWWNFEIYKALISKIPEEFSL